MKRVKFGKAPVLAIAAILVFTGTPAVSSIYAQENAEGNAAVSLQEQAQEPAAPEQEQEPAAEVTASDQKLSIGEVAEKWKSKEVIIPSALVYVDGEGEKEDHYETLMQAIAGVSENGTINVTGTAKDTEPVTVNKNVTLLSDGADGLIPVNMSIEADVTLGGGSNVLSVSTTGMTVSVSGGKHVSVENNVYISGALPFYVQCADTEVAIHGGRIEQTVSRNDWNCAVGVYEGLISEITGGEIIGLESGVYYANIGTISGGTIIGGVDGIYLYYNSIGEISGGTINGTENGIYMQSSDQIGTISGGTITGTNGAAVYCNEESTIGEITGGVLIGNNGIYSNGELTGLLKCSGGVIKAVHGHAFPETDVYLSGSVMWTGSLRGGYYSVENGYEPATGSDTDKAEDVPGDFHYLKKIVTVTYDANGGKTAYEETERTRKGTGNFRTLVNPFENKDLLFREWNTREDASGDSYKESAEFETGEDITLYAIWKERPKDPVWITRNGETAKYRTILEAVEAAQTGDTLVLMDDVVDIESVVVINKDLSIVAGKDSAKSYTANFIVTDGAQLTLGSGDADMEFILTGIVEVQNGHILFRDGAVLQDTLRIISDSATGTVTGGRITAKGNAIDVNEQGHIDEISGGIFISTGSDALNVFGTIDKISGNAEFRSTGTHYACVVRPDGKIGEITGDVSMVVEDTAGNDAHGGGSGMLLLGSLESISGGLFEGFLGLQIGGRNEETNIDYTMQSDLNITGGTFRGYGTGGYATALNYATYKDNPYKLSISNATIISDNECGITVGGGNTLTKLENCIIEGSRISFRTFNEDAGAGHHITIGSVTGNTFTGEISFSGNIAMEKFDGNTVYGHMDIDGFYGSIVTDSFSGNTVSDGLLLYADTTQGYEAKIGTFEGNAIHGYNALDVQKGAEIASMTDNVLTASGYYALYCAGHIGSISGGSITAEKGNGVGIHIGPQEEPEEESEESVPSVSAPVETIEDVIITADIGIQNYSAIPLIKGVDITANSYGLLNNGTVEKIEDSSFAGYTLESVLNNGAIEEIAGGSFTGSSSYAILNNGMIRTIADGSFTSEAADAVLNNGVIEIIANGSFTGKTSDAVLNNGEISEITGGGYTGDNDAIQNNGTIKTITGGNYSGTNWFGIWNCEGASIGKIAIPQSAGSVFAGGYAAIGNYGEIGSVTGYGRYIGGDWESLSNMISDTVSLESGSDSALDLDGSNRIGYGRYAAGGNVLHGFWSLPDGYHMSEATEKIDGMDFHYLVKKNIVFYNGNGHSVITTGALDSENVIPVAFEDMQITISDNNFTTDGETSYFEEEGARFTGWNTKADGSGTFYEAGAAYTFAENDAERKLTLYAQWEEITGAEPGAVTGTAAESESENPGEKSGEDAVKETPTRSAPQGAE